MIKAPLMAGTADSLASGDQSPHDYRSSCVDGLCPRTLKCRTHSCTAFGPIMAPAAGAAAVEPQGVRHSRFLQCHFLPERLPEEYPKVLSEESPRVAVRSIRHRLPLRRNAGVIAAARPGTRRPCRADRPKRIPIQTIPGEESRSSSIPANTRRRTRASRTGRCLHRIPQQAPNRTRSAIRQYVRPQRRLPVHQ